MTPTVAEMTPEEIHAWVAHKRQQDARHLARAPREERPADVENDDWKNRHKVSVKLKPYNFADLTAFNKATGLTTNASINFIINCFFHG